MLTTYCLLVKASAPPRGIGQVGYRGFLDTEGWSKA